MFVNYDYIGPSRNQYPLSQWFRILRANRSLPDGLRKPRLARPSLLIMLRTDPTEAIHASLVPDTIARYFSILERHDAGGGIAYPILTHNPKLAEASREVVERHVPRLLAVDRQETSDGKVPPMFSYFLCRPDKAALADPERLHEWEEEENRREAWATRHRGVYSWPQYIELQTVLRARHLVRRIATRVAGPLNSQPAG